MPNPCAKSQPRAASAFQVSLVSSPSATTSKPRRCARSTTLSTITRSAWFESSPPTNTASTFKRSTGSCRSVSNDEYPVPKSSMAIETPASRSRSTVNHECSGLAPNARSVTSTSRREGGNPTSASTPSTSAEKFRSCRLRRDTLTASFTSSIPDIRMPCVEVRSTISVTPPISSVCSTSAMKSFGWILPYTG